MSAESLQKILKTLADPTRVRILSLLEREELAVQELMEVLGMAQSRVSRHLGILREAGLLRDRREGTYVFYRFAAPEDGAWRDAWALGRRELEGDPATERDVAALARVLEARASRARSFFDSVGPEWDALRKVFNDDVLRARALAHLAPRDWTVADVGTGTGILAIELARLGLDVIAVDHSPRMLEAARAKLAEEGFAVDEKGVAAGARPDGAGRVELRGGEAGALPLADGEVDAALAHMVLHYLPAPADALREMARVVRPGGAVVVVDFVRHEAEWMRDELGVQWLGFPPDEVAGWLRDVGLELPRVETIAARSPVRELPAAFIASARRPTRASVDAQPASEPSERAARERAERARSPQASRASAQPASEPSERAARRSRAEFIGTEAERSSSGPKPSGVHRDRSRAEFIGTGGGRSPSARRQTRESGDAQRAEGERSPSAMRPR